MPSFDELKELHKADRLAVRKIEKLILSHGKFSFNSQDLHNLGIRKLHNSFEGKQPKLDPCFFTPYPQDIMVRPTDGWTAQKFPSYAASAESPIERARSLYDFLAAYLGGYRIRKLKPEHIKCNSEWVYQDINEYGFKGLDEDGRTPNAAGQSPPQWVVLSIYHNEKGESPHLKGTMISDIEGKDVILYRGEILALVRIIKSRLHQSAFATHDFHPVFMLSITGTQHVRIIQGHFDGTILIIQHSKFYNMQKSNDDTLKLLASLLFGPAPATTRK
ncbi:hypothetical protein B7463_g9815, partial [Scytalidium lignicola]